MGYVKIEMDQHPQAILWHIWETSKNAEFFFLKNYPPALQKPFLKIQRVPPLDVEKIFSSNQVFIKAMLWHLLSRFQNGITLRYCKYFLKIFFQKIEKKYFEKYFWPNIYKKYLQYPSVIPFWNRENKCHNMALIKTWFEEIFFSTSKGPPLWIFKNGFCSAGG